MVRYAPWSLPLSLQKTMGSRCPGTTPLLVNWTQNSLQEGA